MKIACVIPTVINDGNVKNLNNLLISISIQEFAQKPSQIIIVYFLEADKTLVSDVIKKWQTLNVIGIESSIASTAYQRNIGIGVVSQDTSFILILDDDIIFNKDSFKEMHACLKKYGRDSKIGGFAFNIITDNTIKSKMYFLKYLFLMGDYTRGNVLRSGFATMICPVQEDIMTQWLFSGASLWRKEVFDKFKFDNWYADYGLGEDLDFSYQVSKKYKLMVCAKAKVKHLAYNTFLRNNYIFGKKQVLNKYHFIRKHKEFSKIYFLWAFIGKIAENIFMGFKCLNMAYFKRALGNCTGIAEIVLVMNK